ncbi:hypothetical protein GCM10009802_23270 [Streptomyces synnematoformans]|uniref:Uncharacterized protein n=1 Tax=Streptomyces synnematoformans TaxID=415721 RepID=A0ABN2Y246_9ACTN
MARRSTGRDPVVCGGGCFGHFGELPGCRTPVDVTRDGTRGAAVCATGDGGQDAEQAMGTRAGTEPCRSRASAEDHGSTRAPTVSSPPHMRQILRPRGGTAPPPYGCTGAAGGGQNVALTGCP